MDINTSLELMKVLNNMILASEVLQEALIQTINHLLPELEAVRNREFNK